MNNQTIPFPKVAEIALSMVSTAQVPASDEALAMAQAVRQFLRAIATGQLIVVESGANQAGEQQALGGRPTLKEVK